MGRVFHKVRARERTGETVRPSSELCHILVSQILKVRVLEALRSCEPIVCVVGQHFEDNVLRILANMGNELGNANELLGLELKFHMRCNFLKLVQQLLRRRA